MPEAQTPWPRMRNCKSYPYRALAPRIPRADESGNSRSEEVLIIEDITKSAHHIRIAPEVKRNTISFAGNDTTDRCNDCLDGGSNSFEINTRQVEPKDSLSPNNFFSSPMMQQGTPTIAPILTYPDEYLIPVKFYSNILDYFRGACENNHFVRNQVGELVSHASATSILDVNNFYKCCVTAIDLLERGYYAQGFGLVSNALWLVERLLEIRDPKLIDTICDVAVLLLTKGWNQIYEILMERICCMVQFQAMKNNEQHHPWAQLFTYLQKLPTYQALDVLRMGWKSGLDQLEQMHPGQSWEWLNMNCVSDYPLRMRDKDVAKMHQDILSAWFDVPQPQALSSMRQQFACGNVLFYARNDREALGTMQSIVARCTQAREQGEDTWTALEVEALEVSARCHLAMSKLGKSRRENIHSAVALLETAIERSQVVWGAASATTIALQHNLWLWLLEQGRSDEAEVLRSRIDAVVIELKAGT